ncbi:MAG: monovalent cation/H(+) antiporter subunit G [Proteobacteria bacterium]|nr:monovalent cation/H(+) antiporter subunit G [Pseudomonadota bacterium]
MIADIFSWIFILGGCVFLVIGGVGVLRMPDLFTRMHAASITDTLGAGLLILGMMIQGGFTLVTVKLFLIMLFAFFAGPTATHALAQAALSMGIKPLLSQDRRPDAVQSDDKGDGL